MAKYALVDNYDVKEVVIDLPQDVHPDLQKMYKLIPEALENKVAPGWTYKGGQWKEKINLTFETYDSIMEIVRMRRDTFLSETDRYMMSDYPISPSDLENMKAYRQLLRDLPESVSKLTRSINDVVFPENPIA